MPIPNRIRGLFSLDAPIDRRTYVRMGLALMALKYTVDAAVIYAATGIFWHPLDYLLPMLSVWDSKLGAISPGVGLALLIWTIPFVWVGVLLSVRRAWDAGLPAWIAVASHPCGDARWSRRPDPGHETAHDDIGHGSARGAAASGIVAGPHIRSAGRARRDYRR